MISNRNLRVRGFVRMGPIGKRMAVVFAEHEFLHGAGVADDSGANDCRRDVADTPKDRLTAQDVPQHIVFLHAASN
jgi:hypothetical protein